MQVELANRRFDAFSVDVAFEAVAPDAEVLTVANPILAGIGLAPLAVPIFPVEDHVAQKLHAYTRLHGAAGRQSTRVKDLVDLVLIARAQPFPARRLRAALTSVFAGAAPPTAVPPPPRDWGTPYARLARQVGLDPDVAAAYAVWRASWTRCSAAPPATTIAGADDGTLGTRGTPRRGRGIADFPGRGCGVGS